MTTCSYCPATINDANDYRRVAGWERITRPSTDTKAFHAPKRLEQYACADCVRKLARGVNPHQERLT